MTTAPNRRSFTNAATLLVAGPAVASLLFAIKWILDRPHPLDVWFEFRAFLMVGAVAGVIVCLVYCAFVSLAAAVPRVVVGRASWQSFGPERKYWRDVLKRTPMSDDAFAAEIALERPDLARTCGEVRHIFAELIDCRPELLTLDDDFGWDNHPVSGSALVKDIERRFGVTISDADAECTRPTIRAVAGLVEELRRAQATTPQA